MHGKEVDIMENRSFADNLRNPIKQPINHEQYERHLGYIMQGIRNDAKINAQNGIHECKGYLVNAGYDNDTYGVQEAPDFSRLRKKKSVYEKYDSIPIDITIVFQAEDIDRYISDIKNELTKLGFNDFICKKEVYERYRYRYELSDGFLGGVCYKLVKTLEKSGYSIYVSINW